MSAGTFVNFNILPWSEAIEFSIHSIIKLLGSNNKKLINGGYTVSWHYLDIRVIALERNGHDEGNERKSSRQAVYIFKLRTEW
jgi:hypothetical protein